MFLDAPFCHMLEVLRAQSRHLRYVLLLLLAQDSFVLKDPTKAQTATKLNIELQKEILTFAL